jgi:hypothetical protein
MWDLCRLVCWVLVDLFRPRAKLEAEILVLRQQINVLRRTAPKRLLLSSIDRLIFVGLYRLSPDVRGALTIVKPDAWALFCDRPDDDAKVVALRA